MMGGDSVTPQPSQLQYTSIVHDNSQWHIFAIVSMNQKFSRDKHLPRNAIGSVLVEGLVIAENGADIAVEAHLLNEFPPVETIYHKSRWRLPDGIPPTIEVKLPQPKNLRLNVTAGSKLGKGRCGNVYSVSATRLYDPSNPSDSLEPPIAPVLPELVIKVTTQQGSSLAQEAAIYQEMMKIQGVSIPRCYGWFEVDLEEGYTVRDLIERHPSDDSPSMKLSFLLLERLGDPLTMRVDYQENEDLWDVFFDLGRMSVEHRDMRYDNILCAPKSPLSFPGKKCPYHKRVHQFRVIDFDQAVKSDYSFQGHMINTRRLVAGVLEGVAGGYRVEPWFEW
ncbi:hypothetical protein A0H81_07412 [Grifola frondosa]|uniref:Protein kinase domain-containing protein n=1 Tax=Grifola frondosa TaxID=5627 RepID=A0A1C7M823_GRIFR|nr:hypothetical protein A0H81_07412 [Grifola frondosa]